MSSSPHSKAYTDGNGCVDLQEFTVAYSTLKKYKEDPNGTAKKAALVEALLGVGSRVVPCLSQAVETGAKVSETVKVQPPKDASEKTALLPTAEKGPDPEEVEEALNEAGAQVNHMLNMIICAFCTLFTLLIILTVGPTIAFWVGVFSGEKCNQPLDVWMLGMAISSTINAIPLLVVLCAVGTLVLALMSGGAPDGAVGADGGFDQEKMKATFMGGSGNASLDCVSKLLQLFGLIWYIYGAMIFDSAGGFGSTKTQCMTKAPTLFDITYYYYMISIIMMCSVCAIPCLICCCVVALGGSPTQGAMNQY